MGLALESPLHILPPCLWKRPLVQLMNGLVRRRRIAMLLNGWKEISNHVQRAVRTVQRWERVGLPVTRITNSARSPVIARSEELDQWLVRLRPSSPQPFASAEFTEIRSAAAQRKRWAKVRAKKH